MNKIISILTILLFSVVMGSGVASAACLPAAPTIISIFAGSMVVGLSPLTNIIGVNMTDLAKSGRMNMGGLRVTLYYGLWDDVETWPTIADQTTADMADVAKLTGDIVMKAGKRMFEMYGTMNTIELKNDLVGPLDGQSFKQTLSLKHPSLAAALLGFQAATANENLVAIVKRHDGTTYLLGSEGFPLMKSGDTGGSGKSVEDGAFTEMTFETYGYTPAPIYVGSIPLTIAGSGSGS